MKSKTPVVRFALIFRPYIVKIWGKTPRIISKFLLRLFRHSESNLGFILRYLAVYRLSKKCGEKVIIFPSVVIKNLHSLELGNNISIHEFCYLDAFGGISIGDDVAISHNVSIISFDHDISDFKQKFKDSGSIPGKITLGNNIWIGASTKILKAVTIGESCVIGAGSVVTKSIPSFSIVVGIPAKVIKKLSK